MQNDCLPLNYLFVTERISLDGRVLTYAKLHEHHFRDMASVGMLGGRYELTQESTRILINEDIEERYKEYEDLAELQLVERVRKICEEGGIPAESRFIHGVPPDVPVLRTALADDGDGSRLGQIFLSRKFTEAEEIYFSNILSKVGYEFREGKVMPVT
ncbi:hypothetical protein HYX09_00715 [Candidatus Woesearchaeota archaeon]|nr:hypothetical protein [Candidatus Woesearchaeota archaeon]